MSTVRHVAPEPPKGSIVLSDGPTGTAWQRHFSDGRWHSTTGRVRTWSSLQAYATRFAMPLIPIYNAQP